MSMMYIRILVGLHIKYYTDFHLVDEDMMTIVRSGSKWNDGSTYAGLVMRFLFDQPFVPSDHVASNTIRTLLP